MIKGVCYKLVFIYIKVSECIEKTYYQRNRDVVLNRAKGFCKNGKERLRDNARDKYRNLTEEKKCKKRIWKK